VAAPEGGEIPDKPPGNEQRQVAHIEGIGQPTTPGFFTLSNVDPTNWYANFLFSSHQDTLHLRAFMVIYCFPNVHRWIFEKYDGVRGFWNPTTKTFYSRTGHPLRLPQKVTDAMPNDIFLDGEIW